jgi:DNA-binding transcriptional MocR family regulator
MSGIRSRWITGDGRQGLVFGYGLIGEERIEEGVGRLAAVMADVRAGR